MLDGRTRETIRTILHFINVFVQTIVGILIIGGIIYLIIWFFK